MLPLNRSCSPVSCCGFEAKYIFKRTERSQLGKTESTKTVGEIPAFPYLRRGLGVNVVNLTFKLGLAMDQEPVGLAKNYFRLVSYNTHQLHSTWANGQG